VIALNRLTTRLEKREKELQLKSELFRSTSATWRGKKKVNFGDGREGASVSGRDQKVGAKSYDIRHQGSNDGKGEAQPKVKCRNIRRIQCGED